VSGNPAVGAFSAKEQVMALIINTNISALQAQNNLSTSQTSLQTSLQRLSSGLRINSAKDDAAGLAVAARMTSQINGLDQAVRNANDGVSLAQTAEGSLQSAGDLLQRIRQLAVQSANATNSASDRQALQAETSQLTAELDRIAQTAQFNGRNLLDGSFGSATFQVGANANQTITANTANFRTNQYGGYRIGSVAASATSTYGDLTVGSSKDAVIAGAFTPASSSAGSATSRIANNGTMTINGATGSAAVVYAAGTTAATMASLINAQSATTGVTATAKTEVLLANLAAGSTYSMTLVSDNPSNNPVTVSFTVGGTSGTPTADNLNSGIKAFNDVSAKTGVTAKIDASGDGIQLTNSAGNNMTLTDTGATSIVISNMNELVPITITSVTTATTSVITGALTIDSSKSFSLTDTQAGWVTVAATAYSSQLQAVNQMDVSNVDAATRTISIVDNALAVINGQRADFGALQARFTSVISNLQATSLNVSAARSRIQDTNFAAETANYTQNQILQQAGTAMLAQANTLPQLALTLLAKLP
jgi:flagellin